MSKFPKHRHTAQKNHGNKKWSRPWFARWHWRLGLVFVPLVCWLLLTGVLLQYAGRLGLDKQPVHSQLLLDWYGIPEAKLQTFPVSGHWLSDLEQQWYFDHQAIAAPADELLLATAFNDMIVAVGRKQLVLLTADGELIEIISDADLPSPVIAASFSAERLVLQTAEGYFRSEDLLTWHPMEQSAMPAPMIASATMPVLLQEAIGQDWRARQLHWERVLQDLHSGRMFGVVGEWLSNLAAMGLLFLSFSGIWMWWKRRHGNHRQVNR
ncbi:PepSY domain-containing protein [Permianibacter aggregans]|uniref:PepSY-associated transmembrane protein n=1 Tax=Permianibacter aggregans TaxID=1510150 RepID=A0A4R6UMH5_9GAMM|nr:PepSY-associated TM helix domain-containing protein [Permianibacter aggregans]QGX41056.1 hypothetical protein E2H98_15840 [Permianibacter aggregans]TDQ48121.1 PepSY-associated transmembrane protein [Permianibacter aggregans]